MRAGRLGYCEAMCGPDDGPARGITSEVGQRLRSQAVGHDDALTPGVMKGRPCVLVRLAGGDVAGADDAGPEALPHGRGGHQSSHPSIAPKKSSASNTSAPLRFGFESVPTFTMRRAL